MKLSTTEQALLALVRRLDPNQRRHLLDELRGHVQANELTSRIAKIKRLRTSPDHRVKQVYGTPIRASLSGK